MILQGRNLIIKNDGVALAAAKSCTIEVQADEIEVSSPQTGQWKTYIAGQKSWKVDVSGLVTWQRSNLGGHLRSILAWPGQTLTMQAELSGSTLVPGALPFDGFVENLILQDVGTALTPDAINWDTVRNIFVARVGFLFYNSWIGDEGYVSPATNSYFYMPNGKYYVIVMGSLVAADQVLCSGLALCRTVRAAGTVGSLASYTAQFQGSGELTIGE